MARLTASKRPALTAPDTREVEASLRHASPTLRESRTGMNVRHWTLFAAQNPTALTNFWEVASRERKRTNKGSYAAF